jgi:hypothetical protein
MLAFFFIWAIYGGLGYIATIKLFLPARPTVRTGVAHLNSWKIIGHQHGRFFATEKIHHARNFA